MDLLMRTPRRKISPSKPQVADGLSLSNGLRFIPGTLILTRNETEKRKKKPGYVSAAQTRRPQAALSYSTNGTFSKKKEIGTSTSFNTKESGLYRQNKYSKAERKPKVRTIVPSTVQTFTARQNHRPVENIVHIKKNIEGKLEARTPRLHRKNIVKSAAQASYLPEVPNAEPKHTEVALPLAEPKHTEVALPLAEPKHTEVALPFAEPKQTEVALPFAEPKQTEVALAEPKHTEVALPLVTAALPLTETGLSSTVDGETPEDGTLSSRIMVNTSIPGEDAHASDLDYLYSSKTSVCSSEESLKHIQIAGLYTNSIAVYAK
jgi:hypothetical protein